MTLRQYLPGLLLAGLLTGLPAGAVQTPAGDNTGANKGDGKSGAVTADKQKMNKPDQETARQIRRSVIADKSLSMYAHNVKIVVRDGMVTLRGPVRSDDEKTAVFNKAVSVSGQGKVVNEIEVVPSK